MKIVIVGSGLGGVTLAETLARENRHEVVLLTGETSGYYARPRLSHGFACDDATAARIVMRPYSALAGITVMSGVWVERIERDTRKVVLQDGTRIGYDRLVLATGSAARLPPALAPSRDAFFTLNSYADMLAIRARRAERLGAGVVPRWAIVGGGLIGCEVASDLNKAGDAVTLFHIGPRLLEMQLAPEQSEALHQHFADHGVELQFGQDVRAISAGDGGATIQTATGSAGPFDGAIVAAGFAPRVELAQAAGLETRRGIVVDDHLRTADPDIHALGDVAERDGRTYAFVVPIRHQALWLAEHLLDRATAGWTPPDFVPIIKIHGFKAPAPTEATA